ncbi:hypothetical protein GCM10010324_01680 [Streptomyces hiroshimensis]|uniref:SnoaL-like domain-containing protein n=2 Tax=Streptomyces hiroshimensis TaxID=66424 RepID=A0ABQ2Y493_9ACTN|nr:hypothetical protein GCM10010324_01680 [Streptomyces hiroshimensis]
MREFGIGLFEQWTAMWNGDSALADRIMAPEFRLRYAQAGTESFDDVRRPAQLVEVIAGWHRARPGLRFAAEGVAAVDLVLADGAPSGRVARPYRAAFTEADGSTVARSGIDMLGVSGGLITEVWSVSGGVGGRMFYR